VILRSDGTPTYHFGVVVDDGDMRITHVIRGDDHLNNTPRHINLFRALELPAPRYAHIPMIAGPDGAKLSKRHGAVNVLEYRDRGYLPEALLNYLVRLGWAHGDQELFGREEMCAVRSVGWQRSVTFDTEAQQLNQQYIKSTPAARLAGALVPHLESGGVTVAGAPATLERFVEAFRERAKTLREMAERVHVYVVDALVYEPKAAQKFLQSQAAASLRAVREELAALPTWTEAATQAVVERVAAAAGIGLGKVAQPLRVAVTGDTASPPIGLTLELLGRERTLARIDRALEFIAVAKTAG
jgi:glutamyl-tRNA synthetase